jgi:hypothetical protein
MAQFGLKLIHGGERVEVALFSDGHQSFEAALPLQYIRLGHLSRR